LKRKGFCYLKNTEKPHSVLFTLHHAISPFSELHNNNLLYLLWNLNFRVKRCTPSLFSQSVVGKFTPNGMAGQVCAQQTEKSHSHINSAVLRQVYPHALLVQHLQSLLFQHIIWYGPTSETACMQRWHKNWLKYTDFPELKKITN